MIFRETPLAGAWVLEPERIEDERGFFARTWCSRDFAELSPADAHAFVDQMRQNKIDGWKGPPGGFVYFLLRSDAVDVVYGTVAGYKSLDIPYMAHIEPKRSW